jgi:hypothetical protein
MNYPAPSNENQTDASPPSAPILLDVGVGIAVPEFDQQEVDSEAAQPWNELTRAAREAQRRGDFEAMQTQLEQAAAQLSAYPPADSQRRAVFGMRARLALELIGRGKTDAGDVLAEQVFEEVENEPELGGPAVVDLAYQLAIYRRAKAEEAGLPESQLPLLRIALASSESAAASRSRLQMAFSISEIASQEGDQELARRAIDRALLDAQIIAPLELAQLGAYNIFKARIALAQGDLATAEASATSANRLFAEARVSEAELAVAEATLARVIAERGDEARARVIATGAQARLDGEPPVPGFARRVVLSELGRLERTTGHPELAMDLFREALEIPGNDFGQDVALVKALTRELQELETMSQNPVNTSDTSDTSDTPDTPDTFTLPEGAEPSSDWSNDPADPPAFE